MDVENAFSIHHSRTFVLKEEIEAIQKAGLARGVLDNAVVIVMTISSIRTACAYGKELVTTRYSS